MSYLGWLEAHLELLAACERRQHHVVQRLIGPRSIRHLFKVHEGVAQGTNACRENCSISERPKLGEDTPDRAQRGGGTDVAQPHPVGGGIGPLPFPGSAAL